MTDRLSITITAANGTSQTFQAISRDADKMGTSVEAAGKKGARSFAEWGDSAKKVGAAIGAVGAVAIKLAGDAEAAEARLTTAFTNAGLAVDDYQDRIDKLADEGLQLGFDDEDVTDSLARLVGATGDYERAVADLAIAQDLARSRQISLAEATNTVLAVEAGRFRSLQQMGIALDETATKEEALAAVQQRVAGSAEAFATTGAADFQRWQNTAENALEAIGARFVNLQGPILAASASITAFGTVASALSKVEVGAKLASLALGPAGLVAAAGLAVGGLVLLGKSLQDTNLDADEAAKSIEDFNAFVAQLGSSGASVELTQTLAGFRDGLEWLALGSTNATTALGPLYDELDRLNVLIEQNRAAPDYLQEDTAAYEAQVAAIEQQIAAMESAQVTSEQFGAAQAALADIVQRTGQINYPILIARLQELEDEFKSGTITADEYAWNLVWLQENAATYGVTLGELANQQRAHTETVRDHVEAIHEAESANAQALAAENARFDAIAESITTGDVFTVTLEQIAAASQRSTSAMILNTEAIEAYAEALGQMPAGETFGERLAQRAGAAGAALGDAFRTGVGNVGDLGGQAQSVANWADELSNVEDGYSEINQLFDEGRLTANEYNAAIKASNRIQSENAEIQRNVLDIQATQLPILADLTAQQQRYLEHIAKQPAELQAVALAYMDTETSAKALELTQLAAAAAAGTLGVAGEDAATKMIQGAVTADPYLAALLEDMGLISVGADGTITVHFGTVEDAGASLDDVIDSLDQLADILTKVFAIFIDDSSAITAKGNVDAVGTALELLDGDSATVYATADTTAAYSSLTALANTTFYTNVVPIVAPSNPGVMHGGVVGYADGGVVARMAEAGPELLYFRDGGMGVAMRDGLYNVPRGTYVTPAPETKRQLAAPSAGGIHLHGPVYVYPATADVEREFTAAIVGGWR